MRYPSLRSVFFFIILSLILIGCGQKSSDSSDDQMNSGIPASLDESDYPSEDSMETLVYNRIMKGMKEGEKDLDERSYIWNNCSIQSSHLLDDETEFLKKVEPTHGKEDGDPIVFVTSEIALMCVGSNELADARKKYIHEIEFKIWLNEFTKEGWQIHSTQDILETIPRHRPKY